MSSKHRSAENRTEEAQPEPEATRPGREADARGEPWARVALGQRQLLLRWGRRQLDGGSAELEVSWSSGAGGHVDGSLDCLAAGAEVISASGGWGSRGHQARAGEAGAWAQVRTCSGR